jgi:uncharacterized protein
VRRWLTICLLLLVAAACSGAESGAQGSAPSPDFRTAAALIETDEGARLVHVEVAQTPEQISRGLMYRQSLDHDAGMIFLFFEPSREGFWMKNTLIPLSIAFFDQRGRILEIMDMEPCRKEPCRLYSPGVPYSGALEVNQGAFAQWGVREGDFIRMNQ